MKNLKSKLANLEFILDFRIFILDSILTPSWLIAISAALVVAALSYRLRLLTADGSIAAFVVGSLVFGFGGIPFSVPLILFFTTSSLLSRLGKGRKKSALQKIKKGSHRDAMQVAANGLLPTCLLLAWAVHPAPQWTLLYLAALSSATADTWATEIGLLSKSAPRSIVTFEKLMKGTSGGVTLLGIVAAGGGALLIALSGILLFPIAPAGRTVLTLTIVGLLSQTIDSILGATLQVVYRCQTCGQETERKTHCGRTATHIKGHTWLDNDGVNFVSGLFAVLLAWTIV